MLDRCCGRKLQLLDPGELGDERTAAQLRAQVLGATTIRLLNSLIAFVRLTRTPLLGFVQSGVGAHLNFRDPDDIPLEFFAPNSGMAAALQELRTRDISRAEILALIEQQVGSDYLPH